MIIIIFDCSFLLRGFGSMSEELGLESECYKCNAMVKPHEVIPNKDNIKRKTAYTHSCSGCIGIVFS
jgi:hypothetical protein